MTANPRFESESASGIRAALLRDGDGGGGVEVEEARMGIDEMLRRRAGEFGRWQLRHFLLTSTAWVLEALHTMVMIFADREPAWRFSDGPCPEDPCLLGPGEWEWAGGPATSTMADWGLVCGDKYKVGLVQSSCFAGCMIGE